MKQRASLEQTYVVAKETSRLGLELGRKIGLLDPSTKPTTKDTYDTGKWDKLHRELVVVDSYSAAIDLKALQRGRVDVVVQALQAEELFVQIPPQQPSEPPPEGLKIWEHVFKEADLVERVSQVIDEHLRFIEAYNEYIELALTEADVQRIVQTGKIAFVMMLASGVINNDLDVLKKYYQLGIRVMALCHLASVGWADSNAELKETPGLTDFGQDVVKACNRIGILVDLSHASDQTCWDALDVATEPIIATHSKCRALSNSPRDLSDDMMRAIAETEGVVGILASTPRTSAESQQARLKRDRRLAEKYSEPFELAAAKLADAEIWGTKLDLESIDHAVNMVGIDHVGLASHFQNVPQWKEFTETLIEHGYNEEDTRKILGENVLRVLKQTTGSE
jgi:membrane dipeptidase